jgi:hypothetical protein
VLLLLNCLSEWRVSKVRCEEANLSSTGHTVPSVPYYFVKRKLPISWSILRPKRFSTSVESGMI